MKRGREEEDDLCKTKAKQKRLLIFSESFSKLNDSFKLCFLRISQLDWIALTKRVQ